MLARVCGHAIEEYWGLSSCCRDIPNRSPDFIRKKISVNYQYSHRKSIWTFRLMIDITIDWFNHFESVMISMNQSGGALWSGTPWSMVKDRLYYMVAGYKRQLVITGHQPREWGRQKGYAAIRDRGENPVKSARIWLTNVIEVSWYHVTQLAVFELHFNRPEPSGSSGSIPQKTADEKYSSQFIPTCWRNLMLSLEKITVCNDISIIMCIFRYVARAQ